MNYLDLILSKVMPVSQKVEGNSQEFFMSVYGTVNKPKATIKMFYPFNVSSLAAREITLLKKKKYFKFFQISHDPS